MDKELRNLLHARARAIMTSMKHYKGGTHRWQGYTGESLDSIEDDKGILFFRKKDYFGANDYKRMYIAFQNINVRNSKTAPIFDAPIQEGSAQETSSFYNVLTNDSGAELERSFTFSTSETITEMNEIQAGVEASINYKLSIGGDASPVKHELDIGLKVTTAYTKQKSTEKGTSAETSTSVTVPPHSQVSLSAIRRLSKFKQKIKFSGLPEHTIEIYSENDYRFKWNSMENFINVVSGKGKVGWTLNKAFRKNRIWWNGGLKEIMEAYRRELNFETVHFFEKSITGNVLVKDLRKK